MNDKSEKALEELSVLGEMQQHAQKEYEAENDAWWNGLTEKERQDAFYAVCKRIHKGDSMKQGSYRYVLYDTFGFGPEMYGPGMDCGYMDIHNTLCEGKIFESMHSINRLEVIDETGRAYTKYIDGYQNLEYSIQDEGKTLKIFIQGN
jgi:hypothetical protein